MFDTVIAGRFQIVELLLESCVFTLEIKGEAMQWAAVAGNNLIVERFLREPGITARDKGTALVAAARAGRESTVHLLLQEADIKLKDVEEAISGALDDGHNKIVNRLIKKASGMPRDTSLVSQHEEVELVDIPLDLEDKVQNFYSAASSGNLEALNQLLLEEEITSPVKGSALLKAVEMRQAVIVKRLLRERDICESDKKEAKRRASNLNKQELVELINKSQSSRIERIGQRIARTFVCGASTRVRPRSANPLERESATLLR